MIKETDVRIATQTVSIVVPVQKANAVCPRIADGALATAEKHPDDALLTATARVVQTQAAPVKMGKPVHVPANGKKTGGRQALKGKQELEHLYLRNLEHSHDASQTFGPQKFHTPGQPAKGQS